MPPSVAPPRVTAICSSSSRRSATTCARLHAAAVAARRPRPRRPRPRPPAPSPAPPDRRARLRRRAPAPGDGLSLGVAHVEWRPRRSRSAPARTAADLARTRAGQDRDHFRAAPARRRPRAARGRHVRPRASTQRDERASCPSSAAAAADDIAGPGDLDLRATAPPAPAGIAAVWIDSDYLRRSASTAGHGFPTRRLPARRHEGRRPRRARAPRVPRAGRSTSASWAVASRTASPCRRTMSRRTRSARSR